VASSPRPRRQQACIVQYVTRAFLRLYTEMCAPAKRSSNEASFWSKRKRSPKESWRLVDAGGSDACSPFGRVAREGRPETIALVVGDGEPVEVEVERQERPHGGCQAFWRCPGCDRRCCALFIVDDLLRCRCCHRLDYRSRHVLRDYPALARAAKLRRRLNAAPGLLSPLPPRPRHHMQAARYDRLARALAVEEATLARMLDGIVHALKRRKGRLHGPR